MYEQQYKTCLSYIDSYWDTIIRRGETRKINRNVIAIPYPYITPNHKKFNFIFYWDTYFMFKGLMGTPKEWILKDMVDNFIYLYEKYHIIPNFNAPASIGRSQPPFLTSMILDTYQSLVQNKTLLTRAKKFVVEAFYKKDPNKLWLARAIDIAKREYHNVWTDQSDIYHHRVEGYILNRYGDRDMGYAHSSELESGWDFTSRFYNRCSEFLPIDLNIYLYKYEKDFALAGEYLDIEDDVKYWEEKALLRGNEVNRLMWNEKEGFFFDWDHHYRQQSEFYSLAGFTPLWAGLATRIQAKRMVEKLPLFLSPYGLFITAKKSLAPKTNLTAIPSRYQPAIAHVLLPKQWDYPNIWPPLEYLTVIGLLRYGFVREAKQIMQRSLKAQNRIFEKYGTLFERVNGETGDRPKSFHYHLQGGFGWTNAIFYRYVQLLDAIEAKKDIFKTPKRLHEGLRLRFGPVSRQGKKPPFDLALPH